MTDTRTWDRGKGWKCTCAPIMHTVQPNTKICLWYTHIRELISYLQDEENECRITPAGEPRSHTAMNDLACCNWWPWVYRISWRAKKQNRLITRAWIFLLPPPICFCYFYSGALSAGLPTRSLIDSMHRSHLDPSDQHRYLSPSSISTTVAVTRTADEFKYLVLVRELAVLKVPTGT